MISAVSPGPLSTQHYFWDNVQKSEQVIDSEFIHVSLEENTLFDEACNVSRSFMAKKLEEWKSHKKPVEERDRLARGKDITVSCSETRDRTGISLLVQQNQELRFTVSIRVSSGSTPYVLLRECALLYPGPLVAFSDPTDLAAGDKEIIIAPGSSYPIGLQCFSRDTGTFVVPLALTFQQGCSSSKQFTVLTFLEVSCSKNTFLELLEANIPKNISAPVSKEDCTKDASAEALEDDCSEGVGYLEVSCYKNASVEPLEVNIAESAPLPGLEDDCSKSVSAEFLENDCSEGVGHLVVSCSENTSMELQEVNILKNTSIPVLEEGCSKDAPSAKLLQDVCSVSVGLSELSCSKSTPVETLVVNCPETASAENLGISWSKGWSGDISVEPLKVEYFSRSTITFGGSTFVEPSKVEYPKDDSVEDLKVNYSKNTSGEALKFNRSKSRYVKDVDVEYCRNSSLEFLEVNFYKNAPVEPLAVNGFKSTHGCNGSKGYQPSFRVHNPQRIGFRNFRGFGRGLPKARCAVEASVQGKPVSDLLYILPLGFYNPPEEYLDLYEHGMECWDGMQEKQAVLLEGLLERLKSPLSPDTYLEVFSTLLFLEEIKIDADFRKPGNASLHLRPLPNYGGWFVLEVPDSLVGNSSILEGSNVKVDLYSGQKKLGPKFAGKITEIKTGMIFLKFSERFQETYKEGMKVDLRFVLNRLPLRLMHRAIRMCNERKLWNFVLPDCDDPSRPAVNISELSFFNRSIETNEEQCSAVKNILLGLHRPYPFLLFGPPGTGKTVTLVEALIQVCTLIPSSHILVVAPSNSACDNLAEKLLGYLGPSQILRIYSASVHRSKLSKKLQHCSNYVAGGTFFYPDVEDLQKYRVIVTTLAGSGKLVSGQVPINHFTHIFVDEAGQSLEPECLIPVVGLMTPWNLKRKGTGGHLILAGDPLQLGPVVCNQWCRDHGLGTSLLERLMKLPPYKRQADGRYNPRMLSKLLKNFRSHKDILEIPNKLFYEGELQCINVQAHEYNFFMKSGNSKYKCNQCMKRRDPSTAELISEAGITITPFEDSAALLDSADAVNGPPEGTQGAPKVLPKEPEVFPRSCRRNPSSYRDLPEGTRGPPRSSQRNPRSSRGPPEGTRGPPEVLTKEPEVLREDLWSLLENLPITHRAVTPTATSTPTPTPLKRETGV
ncbi:putative helicase MOV-10 isoform X1 [Ixodes scapularis]